MHWSIKRQCIFGPPIFNSVNKHLLKISSSLSCSRLQSSVPLPSLPFWLFWKNWLVLIFYFSVFETKGITKSKDENTIFLQHNDAYAHRSLRFTSIKELTAVRWWTSSVKRTLIIFSIKVRKSGSAKLVFRLLLLAKCSIKGCSIQNVSSGAALTLTHWTSKSWCFSSDDRNREFKWVSEKNYIRKKKSG